MQCTTHRHNTDLPTQTTTLLHKTCRIKPDCQLFPKQSLLLGFWQRIFCIRNLISAYFRPSVREFLCDGAVNGDGRVAPVYTKSLGRITFAEQAYMKTHILLPSCLWPPGCLLGASWVLPGSLLGAWMLIGCLLHKRTSLLIQQEDMSPCCTRRHGVLFNKKTCFTG